MSEENVEIVRGLFRRWEQGDYSTTEWADPEIEFVLEDTPGRETSRGIEPMRDSWREFLRAWEGFHGISHKVMDAGDQVLVLNEFGGRGHESGVPISGMRGAALFTFEDSRVVRLVLFQGWDKALEAAGLSE